MTDAILTYSIVAIAAAFVLWRVILPARARSALRNSIAGEACPTETGGGCAGGCSGCDLAASVRKPR